MAKPATHQPPALRYSRLVIGLLFPALHPSHRGLGQRTCGKPATTVSPLTSSSFLTEEYRSLTPSSATLLHIAALRRRQRSARIRQLRLREDNARTLFAFGGTATAPSPSAVARSGSLSREASANGPLHGFASAGLFSLRAESPWATKPSAVAPSSARKLRRRAPSPSPTTRRRHHRRRRPRQRRPLRPLLPQQLVLPRRQRLLRLLLYFNAPGPSPLPLVGRSVRNKAASPTHSRLAGAAPRRTFPLTIFHQLFLQGETSLCIPLSHNPVVVAPLASHRPRCRPRSRHPPRLHPHHPGAHAPPSHHHPLRNHPRRSRAMLPANKNRRRRSLFPHRHRPHSPPPAPSSFLSKNSATPTPPSTSRSQSRSQPPPTPPPGHDLPQLPSVPRLTPIFKGKFSDLSQAYGTFMQQSLQLNKHPAGELRQRTLYYESESSGNNVVMIEL